MGLEKIGTNIVHQTAAWLKAGGKASILQTKPVQIFNAEGLKYVPKLTQDLVQISSHSSPIDAIYNFKQKFGQFMADYRCAFMAKYEFGIFKYKNTLNPDYLLRDMQCYKNAGQKSTSRIEEILIKLEKGGLDSKEKESLIKEFETLCENTLSRKSEFHGLKNQLKQMTSDFSVILKKSQSNVSLKPARNIENPSELVRKPARIGEKLPKAYVENSQDVRMHFNKAIDDGTYLDSYESYVETMNKAHKLAYSGKNGKNLYYIKNGKPYIMEAGTWRTTGFEHRRDPSCYYFENDSVENIAKKYNDPLYNLINIKDSAKTSRVKLKGIPEKHQPADKWELVDFDGLKYSEYAGHSYPAPEALELYHREMYRTAKEAIRRIKNGESEDRILEVLAEHFQYAANARPYSQINNSLYMNEINTLLQRAGMKVMPHSNLDVVAQRLQPETFKKYFIDTYHQTALSDLNIDKLLLSTFDC